MLTHFQEYFSHLVPEAASGRVSVLLGVSGGADSIAMASLFLKLNLDLDIAVAHVNFSLRGESSDGDQTFVEKWCAVHNLKCYVKRFDTRSFASSSGISVEMAARELRYNWFEELCRDNGYEFVAVAHNRNDNVETLFLNLLRGSGLHGITGMKQRSGRIIRPMLDFTREQIESYCRAEGIDFRVDATNYDVAYHRNRIRNNIFPELFAINPSFLETLSRDMSYFAVADDIIEDLAADKKIQLSFFERDILNISLEQLRKERYREFWLYKLLEPYGFNSSQIGRISASVDSQSGKQFFSATHRLIRDRQMLKVYPLSGKPSLYACFDVIPKHSGFDPKSVENGVLYLDAKKIMAICGFESTESLLRSLKCRQWLPSDKFKPLGMKGFKLVSDFFSDLKLDLEQKRREIIVTSGDGDSSGRETIIAIVSRRIDDRFKVTDETTLLLKISPQQCSPVSL